MIDFIPISRHNRKSFWTPVNSERFGVSDIFNKSSDCFQSSRIVNYNFMKNEGCSLISVWILARLPFAGAAWWNFSPHHYSRQQRSPFRLFITRHKLSKALNRQKSLQESTNRGSERVPFHILFIWLSLSGFWGWNGTICGIYETFFGINSFLATPRPLN